MKRYNRATEIFPYLLIVWYRYRSTVNEPMLFIVCLDDEFKAAVVDHSLVSEEEITSD
jgi:hypothetical protein